MTRLDLTKSSIEDAANAIQAHIGALVEVRLPTCGCVDSLLQLLFKCHSLKELHVNMMFVTRNMRSRHMTHLTSQLTTVHLSSATAFDIAACFHSRITVIVEDIFLYTPAAAGKQASLNIKAMPYSIADVDMLMRRFRVNEATVGLNYHLTTVFPYDLKIVELLSENFVRVVRLTKKAPRRSVFVGLNDAMSVPYEPMNVFTLSLTATVMTDLAGYEKYIDTLTVYRPLAMIDSRCVTDFMRRCTHLQASSFGAPGALRKTQQASFSRAPGALEKTQRLESPLPPSQRARVDRSGHTESTPAESFGAPQAPEKMKPVLPVPLGQSVGIADIWSEFMSSAASFALLPEPSPAECSGAPGARQNTKLALLPEPSPAECSGAPQARHHTKPETKRPRSPSWSPDHDDRDCL